MKRLKAVAFNTFKTMEELKWSLFSRNITLNYFSLSYKLFLFMKD